MTLGSCFKEAVQLVAAGIVELETDDIGAEITELALVLFDARIGEMEKVAKKGGDDERPTKRSSGGSRKRGSSSKRSSGGSGKPFKNLEGDITDPQARKLKALLEDKDHDLDLSFREVDRLTKQEASDYIEQLLEADDLDY